jgi:hypothetical protein
MATYISLTNELLRRINEVEIDATTFAGARNIQALAKDAVNAAIREILHSAQEWPFAIQKYTQTCVSGTQEYSFPATLSSVDWDSFFLKKNTSLNNIPAKLKVLSFDEYTSRYRSQDESSGSTGYTAPVYVYQTQETKFGLSPIPNGAYEIEYKYWLFPSDLSLSTDTTIIPARFKHVIMDGAMAYLMHFRSNEQSAVLHRDKFDQGIRMMRRILMDDPIDVRSTYVINPIYFPRIL